MTQRWKDYFDAHGAFDPRWLATAVSHWSFHEILYGTIAELAPKPARILDVGSGPGWSVMYLASQGYAATGVDNEPSLVEVARAQAERLNISAEFKCADAFDLRELHGQFDLAFSCGVLEHFDRDVTVQLLREQAKCARQVLIQIPTKFTAYAAPLTDERIYTVSQLAGIVEDAGLKVVRKFGYGDVTATRSQVWLRRLLPRMAYRQLQNYGFGYAMAVVGSSGS
jgi:SAM-dependent methyltransferase